MNCPYDFFIYEIILSTNPYFTAAPASMKLSRSVSSSIFLRGWPVCLERILFRLDLVWRMRSAWILMSVAWPWNPPRT